MDLQLVLEQIKVIAIEFVPNIIGAILIWFIGIWVVKALSSKFGQLLDKRNVDASLKPFVKGLFNALLRILLIISVLGTLGIKMTSFVAIIGAAGLAVGLALSGTLQNFAGGVVILIFKPFRVGDFIEAQSYKGTVSEIQIFNTILKTPDNKTIIIPNGGLANSSMTNYSTEPRRRVDWVFGVAYGDDANKAKEVITKLCAEDSRISNDPPVFIALSELGSSSVNFTVRAWVDAPDYWGVFFELNQKVYNNFAKEGLSIPFPQMDVHVHQTA